ncbi:sulfate transporter CysZ [Saccharobesus litoralis]|uniref:Sulfate transporter CysZ n=1 Tax=Saccharobesus litoralis TaxID=2172099 RepID=A0A2S0VXT6_9ALTE|nr:sulfate transporter CysZ [Saccharobesus litoralis]AWB69037.1 sulfate transporter CysZ [Saccharobesus litoralis]
MNYLLDGFGLIQQKGLKRFVFIPLLLNLILFSAALWWMSLQLDAITNWVYNLLPEWLSWLSVLVSPLIIIATFVLFMFVFTTVANFIAAPFNGILAEKTEALLTGQSLNDETSISAEVSRTLKREWQKLIYFIPKSIGFLLLFWFVPVIGQVLWLLFSAWSMAIQYCDYPFDNHKIEFDTMKDSLWQNKAQNLSFGAGVMICTMVPIINFLIMPVAVCGATKMFVERYR